MLARIFLLALTSTGFAFPNLGNRENTLPAVNNTASSFIWSPAQLVDVTGSHRYQDPLPGQARGPCPAQNAMANHGYLDRSGYTTLSGCITGNIQVFNMAEDFATYLCFMGQLTGGDLLGVTWSIDNSSDFDNSIKNTCATSGLLGFVFNLGCCLSKVLDRIFGTPGFGMAQTHNSFESDSSFLHPDWNTINGLDASGVEIGAVKQLWKLKLPDGTFDDFSIVLDWASYRKDYGIRTNPCYFRAPQATLFAGLGAYSFVPRLLSSYTQDKPEGTLTQATLASFFGFSVHADGSIKSKGLGKEQIPNGWYQRPIPYTIAEWFVNDYPQFFIRDRTLGSIGGNTNGVNTFTGIDYGDLTGGVINAENLFEGDNFACFYYRVLQIQLENKLPSAVGGDLLKLGSTLGQVIDAVFGKMVRGSKGVAGCPAFTYSDMGSRKDWCAVRQQPQGIY